MRGCISTNAFSFGFILNAMLPDRRADVNGQFLPVSGRSRLALWGERRRQGDARAAQLFDGRGAQTGVGEGVNGHIQQRDQFGVVEGVLVVVVEPVLKLDFSKAQHTRGNILARKAFTISILSEDPVRQADYFGLVSGRRGDNLAATNLTLVRNELVDAPYSRRWHADAWWRTAPILDQATHRRLTSKNDFNRTCKGVGNHYTFHLL
jgi:hypothetical protein